MNIEHERQREFRDAWSKGCAFFLTGPAGTGKTTIAVKMAIEDPSVKTVYLCRPLIGIDEELGFLPGDVNEKLAPWFDPIRDALQALGLKKWPKSFIPVPLGMLGGRSLRDSVLIIDEGQNATYKQLRNALTRLGSNAKLVVCGDPGQRETKEPAMEEIAGRLKYEPKFREIRFREEDQRRSPFVQRVTALLA